MVYSHAFLPDPQEMTPLPPRDKLAALQAVRAAAIVLERAINEVIPDLSVRARAMARLAAVYVAAFEGILGEPFPLPPEEEPHDPS